MPAPSVPVEPVPTPSPEPWPVAVPPADKFDCWILAGTTNYWHRPLRGGERLEYSTQNDSPGGHRRLYVEAGEVFALTLTSGRQLRRERNGMSKHTDGPWHVELDESDPTMPEYDIIATVPSVEIARVHGFDPGGQADESAEANARLIASAPELLAACKMLLVRLESMPGLPKGGVYDQARASIRKAEGTK